MNKDHFNAYHKNGGKFKKIYCLFSILVLLFIQNVKGQEPCGFKEAMESYFLNFPASQSANNSSSSGTCAGTYEIPVVFHILHDNGPENVSESQINEAMQQLNNQFAGGEGGFNTGISFYIANVDPDGNCTNGINRIQTSTPGISTINFTNDIAMKNLSRWPVEDYLNIWIVDYIGTTGTVGGYAYRPPVSSDVDGVVVNNIFLGTTGTAQGNELNTLSHEIGHYLNLYHLWGPDWVAAGTHCVSKCDLNESCEEQNDEVCDTQPMRHGWIISNCDPSPSNCELCPNFPAGQYFYDKDNYMGYAHPCQDKFTAGQSDRMCTAITDYRPNLPKSKTIGCDNECVTIINSNTTYNSPMSFGGDLIIKSGATLTIDAATVLFGQEKALIVENGGKLILKNNATLQVCPQATFWNGILVETGGELDANQAYIILAKIGVRANQNSTIELHIVNIIGLNNQFGQGIYLDKGVNAVALNRLKIENYDRGIDAWEGNKVYEVTNCEINNVFTGILMTENTLLLSGTTITSSKTGVFLWESIGSIIEENDIGYFNIGLRAFMSPFISITNNTIGWPTQRGNWGINLSRSGGSAISNNIQIQATELGIRMWNTDALIDHNQIDIFGQNNQFGGAVQINNSTGNSSQILENYIDATQSAFGIESVTSTGTRIENNQIDQVSYFIYPRTAAIRSMGSMDEHIEDNTIFGVSKTTGLIAQNSTSNVYQCNVANNTKEGIGIYFNSEMQNIQGNEMDADIDLSIRSEIGVQFHKGNEFLGGSARAYGLVGFPLENSQFTVNTNDPNHPNLMPTDPVPANGWFFDDNNLNPFTCSGIQGPTWTPFNGGNSTELCTYYNYLLSIKGQNPEQFLVKLIHLLKYSKKKANFLLPTCITSDSTFLSLCGVTKLVDLSLVLETIGKTGSDTTITNLQGQYINATNTNENEVAKQQIESLLSTNSYDITQIKLIDSLRLDSIYTELDVINCTDTFIQKWKDVYKMYVEYLHQDTVGLANRPALNLLSQDCSDIYGDAIHLARSMANTYDNTYFDQYDGCGDNVGQRGGIKEELSTILISPNPSTGIFNVRLPESFKGNLSVIDITGHTLLTRDIFDDGSNILDLSAYIGVLFLKFTDEEGIVSVLRVLVIN